MLKHAAHIGLKNREEDNEEKTNTETWEKLAYKAVELTTKTSIDIAY